MQALGGFIALLAIGYGFSRAGFVGALTGLVVTIGVASGLAIAAAERGTSVAAVGAARTFQRAGGVLAALGSAIGAVQGGWRTGWAWAAGGYVLGAAIGLVGFGVFRPKGNAAGGAYASSLPTEFDLDNPNHVRLLDDIRERFSAVLTDTSHPHAACMFRPASVLPYPKKTINVALHALLDFIEGRRSSRLLNVGIRTEHAAVTVSTLIVTLDDFLDLPAGRIPTDLNENAEFGLSLQNGKPAF